MPRRWLPMARRVVLFAAFAGLVYIAWRVDVFELPGEGCSPLHGYAPGDRVLIERRPSTLGLGDAVVFGDLDGALLLGRVVEAPLDLAPKPRARLDAGAHWIVVERRDCPGRDSSTLGPIEPEQIVARLIMTLGW